MQNLGSVLRRARASHNLTIREAASILGLAPGYISEIETGKKIPEKAETLEAFANAYGLDGVELRLLSSLKNDHSQLVKEDTDGMRLQVARKILTEELSSDLMLEIRNLVEGGRK